MTSDFRCVARIALVLVCSPIAPAFAQQSDSAHNANRVALLEARDVIAVAGLAGAVALVMQSDRSIERAFVRPNLQNSVWLKDVSNASGFLGDPGSVILSAGLYFVGLGAHSRELAALGMHTGESVVLGGVLAEVLKGEIGRARPSFSPGDSRLFKSGEGFSSDDYGSLPSAETTAAFAAATALGRGFSRDWPSHVRLATGLAYTGATLVAASRLYKNQHWASDVVAGAGLGTFSAIFVDRFNRRYPNNIFERMFLPSSVARYRGGVAVEWRLN
ncbi:MAG: phosphatase PAP2 family protein [Gemmatimonadales bacterium]